MDLTNILNNGNLLYTLKNIILIVLGFIWAWSIIWVAVDISKRTDNFWLQILSILLVTFGGPIVGLMLYFLIRPPYYLYDKNGWREVIVNYSIICSDCGEYNQKDFDFCIRCGAGLKIKCKECGKSYAKYYEYCPYCGAPNV